MCYYVSWKTTGYYRKDILKLTVRCPVSGCWPSCSIFCDVTYNVIDTMLTPVIVLDSVLLLR